MSKKSGKPLKSFDLAMEHVSAEQMTVSKVARGGKGVLSFSVVNTQTNGKRAKLSRAMHERLGSPETLQFAYNSEKKYLYLAEFIPGATESVNFSSGVGSTTIYNAAFVSILVDIFGLDFTGKSSMSFTGVKVLERDYEGETVTIARIKMEAPQK